MRERDAFEKLDQAGRTPRDRLNLPPLTIPERARHGQPAIGQMIEQREEERQVARIHALLIERQDEASALGLDQIIAVLDPFGDPLGRAQRAQTIGCEEHGHLLGRNMRVDCHGTSPKIALPSPVQAARPWGSLNDIFSTVVVISRSLIA